MESWIVWLIVAAVLVVIEIVTQMVWTLCLAVGCVGGLIADLAGCTVTTQIVVMAITAVVAFIALMPLFKRWHDHSRPHRHAATGMDALIGRRARLTADVVPGGHPGRARIDGDNWQVRAPHCDTILSAGTEVEVTGYDGNILIVK